MRFGLKCVVALAILYHAILASQGGSETAALSQVAEAMPAAQARVRDEIAARVGAYCRGEPQTCLADAARFADLASAGGTGDAAAPRHFRHGALAAAAR